MVCESVKLSFLYLLFPRAYDLVDFLVIAGRVSAPPNINSAPLLSSIIHPTIPACTHVHTHIRSILSFSESCLRLVGVGGVYEGGDRAPNKVHEPSDFFKPPLMPASFQLLSTLYTKMVKFFSLRLAK